MCRLDPPQRAPLPDVGIVVRDRMIPPDTRLAGSVPCLLRPELAETKHLALDLRALIRGLSCARAVEGARRRRMEDAHRRARRGELVERSFAHVLDRGGMRRAWLRGRENIHKRYLIHVAGFNLGVLMRALHGQGTPRQAAEAAYAFIFVLQTDAALAFGLIVTVDGQFAALVLIVAAPPSS